MERLTTRIPTPTRIVVSFKMFSEPIYFGQTFVMMWSQLTMFDTATEHLYPDSLNGEFVCTTMSVKERRPETEAHL